MNDARRLDDHDEMAPYLKSVSTVARPNQERMKRGSKETGDMACEEGGIGLEALEGQNQCGVTFVRGAEETVVGRELLGLFPCALGWVEVWRVRYPGRHPRGEPGMRLVVRVAQYMCVAAECGATWRVLPLFLARHLWRAWKTVERVALPGAVVSPSTAPRVPRGPDGARAWRRRRACLWCCSPRVAVWSSKPWRRRSGSTPAAPSSCKPMPSTPTFAPVHGWRR